MVPDGPKLREEWGTGGGQNRNGFLASAGLCSFHPTRQLSVRSRPRLMRRAAKSFRAASCSSVSTAPGLAFRT